MHKVTLELEEVDAHIRDNRYAITKETLNLPELSFLNDVDGELKLLTKAEEQFGFTLDHTHTTKILQDIFGSDTKKELEKIPLGGAVLFVEGTYSIEPVFTSMIEGRKTPFRIYVYHKTVTDQRHRALAHQLIETAAIEFISTPDEEYVYQIVSNVLDDALFEEIRVKAQGLPIYEVVFAEDGAYKITSLNDLA